MFTAEQMSAIAAKAIFDALTPEKQAELLQQAIAKIIAPAKDNYGRKEASTLESAFAVAIEQQMRAMVFDLVKNDAAIQVQLRKLVAKAAHDTLFEGEERFAAKLSTAIWKAFDE